MKMLKESDERHKPLNTARNVCLEASEISRLNKAKDLGGLEQFCTKLQLNVLFKKGCLNPSYFCLMHLADEN